MVTQQEKILQAQVGITGTGKAVGQSVDDLQGDRLQSRRFLP